MQSGQRGGGVNYSMGQNVLSKRNDASKMAITTKIVHLVIWFSICFSCVRFQNYFLCYLEFLPVGDFNFLSSTLVLLILRLLK